jgi:hypothetical protein
MRKPRTNLSGLSQEEIRERHNRFVLFMFWHYRGSCPDLQTAIRLEFYGG